MELVHAAVVGRHIFKYFNTSHARVEQTLPASRDTLYILARHCARSLNPYLPSEWAEKEEKKEKCFFNHEKSKYKINETIFLQGGLGDLN